jgi:hypothetical protein
MNQEKFERHKNKSFTTKEVVRIQQQEDSHFEQKTKRAKSRKIIKAFKKNRESQDDNSKIVQIVAKKEFSKNELHAIFNGDTVTKNIKTRRKELKVNDTIVAIISFCLVLLTFYQVIMIKLVICFNR